VGGFLGKAFRSWKVIGTSDSQLVDFPEKYFAVGGFLLKGIDFIPQRTPLPLLNLVT